MIWCSASARITAATVWLLAWRIRKAALPPSLQALRGEHRQIVLLEDARPAPPAGRRTASAAPPRRSTRRVSSAAADRRTGSRRRRAGSGPARCCRSSAALLPLLLLLCCCCCCCCTNCATFGTGSSTASTHRDEVLIDLLVRRRQVAAADPTGGIDRSAGPAECTGGPRRRCSAAPRFDEMRDRSRAPQTFGSKPGGRPPASTAVFMPVPPALVVRPVVCMSQYDWWRCRRRTSASGRQRDSARTAAKLFEPTRPPSVLPGPPCTRPTP